MMEYIEHNGERICKTFKDDCVIRSISVVTQQPYKKVFEDLMNLGLEIGCYPNHDKAWVRYLEDRGFIKNRPPRTVNGKLIKLRDWDFKGRAVVRNSGHLTAVENGVVVDAWDCRRRPVNSYWTKE
jgi:hypothetical protein